MSKRGAREDRADAPPSGRRPTIDDVARLAQVSKGAVSFAFNDRPGVSDDTRRRIRDAADQLGWRPNARARALSSSRSLAVGLVMRRSPEALGADPFFPQLLAGVEMALAPRGYALVLQVVGDQDAEIAAYERFVQDGRVDGVILTDLQRSDHRPDLLRSLGLTNVVAVGRPAQKLAFPSIELDDGTGVAEAVAHLVSLGHARIGHVAGTQGYVHSQARRAAWRRALHAAGLEAGPLAVGDFTGRGGAVATRKLLSGAAPPTAIVFANDLMAVAGIATAEELGLRVPDDLSVVGFDDIPLAAYVTPALTTVRQDAVSWGRAAASALLTRIEDRPLPTAQLEAPRLVVRESTGAPAAQHDREGQVRAEARA